MISLKKLMIRERLSLEEMKQEQFRIAGLFSRGDYS